MQCNNDQTKKTAPIDRRPSLLALVGIFILVLFVGMIVNSLGLSGLGSVVTGSIGLVPAFMIGLVASISSCMAVSGGLLVGTVAKYNERIGVNASGAKSFVPTLLFVGGRLVSYVILGGLIATIGRSLDPSPLAYGLIIMAAALTMILLGLDMLHLLPRPMKKFMPRMPASIGRRIMAAESSKHPIAPVFLGAATFFLPCGFTQALQIYALSVGGFTAGAAVLGAFALGTAPALFALGWASGSFRGGFKRFFFMFAGAAIVLLGIGNVFNGLTVLGVDLAQNTVPRSADLGPNVRIVDDVQVVKMKVTANSYEPGVITIKAGMRTRWEIDATDAVGCIRSLVSRSLGINIVLTIGPNVIEFVAPSEPGAYAFSCSMGMYRGMFNVIK